MAQLLELLARVQSALRRHVVYQDVQVLQITRGLDGDDAGATNAVGDQVASGRKEE
jgi:hypothetical protein